MQAMQFLVEIIFDLFLMVVLLRFWLQAAKADFYNPISQFVVKATSFAVNPLRKIIPGLGGFDIASLVLAYLVAVAKLSAVFLLFYGGWAAAPVFVTALITVIKEGLNLLFWVLIIRALLSWVSQGYNPIEAVFHQLTEPMLRPIRKVIPPLGGLDLSILVLIIALQFLQFLLIDLIG
ncbi:MULTISPECIES: YggT family protein [Pseudoalteromonas]|jgi:YggT family protein|uniref:YggT family protein n=1 Tax=Pseudoalteromonas lipolytica TaxID=570156 RepID=A0AAD0WDA4_9GAMM|nr:MULTISPECIES: YggT family protein [Pseudoalteromonas]AXV66160.1 YggT family protein [Pseudoalteromonas donghaensis]EWH07913.1 membrane protein [Pseudoalteromonas lipolytica SCSIO 04301]MBE0350514.1 YggT family protein [Pseudoalteromonas lipolytica LMEB 39]MCC9660091.1 YggT family protein [Pseudoalteromonas sp. MB41]QLJ07680.1 YggT family protein [Pseudoalteromonas sp. JSTW]|tara:strand:- start:1673 stop:2206 length:534 start_codon:yes stop_codon:yes gene_type:complete